MSVPRQLLMMLIAGCCGMAAGYVTDSIVASIAAGFIVGLCFNWKRL